MVVGVGVTQESGRRIVLVDHATEAGGAQMSLLGIAERIAAGPHQVQIWVAPSSRWASVTGATTVAVPGLGSMSSVRRGRVGFRGVVRSLAAAGSSLYRLGRLILSSRPAILYFNTPKASLLGAAPALLLRIPYVVHVRDQQTASALGSRSAVALLRVVQKFAVGVIANSAFTASVLPRVDLVWKTPLSSEFLRPVVTRVRADQFRIVMVGRLDPWKGQDLLLDAVHQGLQGVKTTVTLVGGPLFGRDAFEGELRSQARRFGVSCEFVGQVDDVAKYLDEADVVVVATRGGEPLGQVVVQAQARGRCVVVPDIGGPRELVKSAVDGYTFKSGSALDLAGILSRLAADDALVGAVENAARKSAVDYSSRNTLDTLASFVNDLLEK